jgi:hypothetical protein
LLIVAEAENAVARGGDQQVEPTIAIDVSEDSSATDRVG